ncbi:SPRY domain-containing SOCS box protein 3-like [Orussus abietinus]|uniref:SPRY domain-containing SOCS box protein 3-like n=1 Tax=Orussus abietinus TaxID=222816 RepID=UPI000626B7BA|nr:SPRY domain-containing SOCS box protein 3-like [Orussus abietinus]
MYLDYEPETVSNNNKLCTSLGKDCHCQRRAREWTWDESLISNSAKLSHQNLEVNFHPGFSNGTAVVRADKSMQPGHHHYWEIKMMTRVYGTDVMVGVGTKKVDLHGNQFKFCSLLGSNSESWGFSYRGYLQHDGQQQDYPPGFGQGSIVGVHLDTWRGTLQFFLDRKPLGIAFTGLRGLELYPMISSTAAKSKIRVTYSTSIPASLQMDCLSALRPMQKAYLAAEFPALRYLTECVFAEVLKRDDDDDEDQPAELFTILDEFDYALVGFSKKKRLKLL